LAVFCVVRCKNNDMKHNKSCAEFLNVMFIRALWIIQELMHTRNPVKNARVMFGIGHAISQKHHS
jgi:hypothetical protein